VFKSPFFSHRIVWSALAVLALLPASSAMADGTGGAASRHLLDMYKVEQFVGLDAGDSADGLQLQCPNGDYAVDGMWRIDQVNFNAQIDDPGPYGDWNRYNGVDVTQSESVAKDTWEFTLVNNTDEAAQAKVWITCLGRQTAPDTYRHKLTMSDLHSATDYIAPGDVRELNAGNYKCAPDEIVVAHGFNTDGGVVKMYRSWPDGNSLRRWEFGFYGITDPNVSTSVRCLKIQTDWAGPKNHRHSLRVRFRQNQPTLTPDFVNAVKVDCGDTEKGLLGAFDVRYPRNWGADYDSHQLWYLGQEPQIKSRVFHIQNHSDSTPYNAMIGLVCFDDRTSGPQH
jgi:hypothetical protein